MGNTISDTNLCTDSPLMNQILGKGEKPYDYYDYESDDIVYSSNIFSKTEDLANDMININNTSYPYYTSQGIIDNVYGLTNTEPLNTIQLLVCENDRRKAKHKCGDDCTCDKNIIRILENDMHGGKKSRDFSTDFNKTYDAEISSDSLYGSPNLSESTEIKSDDNISTSELYRLHSRLFNDEDDKEDDTDDDEDDFEKKFSEEYGKHRKTTNENNMFNSEEKIIRRMKNKKYDDV